MSGDFENTIIWELHEPLHASQNWTSKSWQIARETQQVFTEIDDRSEWGNLYFTGPASASHQAGSAAKVRQEFAQRGRLSGEISRNFRSIKENEPVFAFSMSLDPSVGSKDAFVCFSIALVQDPVVQFAAARGLTLMRPFWASFFSDPLEMVRFHYADFPTTSVLAANFSRQLSADARKLDASGYEDLVSLSARQVLGAIQFSGTPQNPILFIKEISSNGNFQTVDVIFPAFPFFLYTNPRWLVYLLEPLIEHQLSGQYPNNYSMHDLGTHFPNATGHGDGQDEYMPLEECGNMLIMCLVAVNAMRFVPQQPWTNIGSGPRVVSIDGDRHSTTKETGLTIDSYGMDAPLAHSGHSAAYSWARRSYSLWKQWADYLVAESLIPQNQLSSDDFAGWLANQTNLALKGIVAIRAMSELSNFVGEKSDGEEYRMVAETYIRRWEKLGISRDRTHAKLAYGWYGSWTTLYNLFADALLCPHSPDYFHNGQSGREKDRSGQHNGQLVSDEIYTMQSKWYHAVVQKYGLPLDSRHLYAKSDWEVFAAAVSSKKTRTIILESIARWVNETVTGKLRPGRLWIEPSTNARHREDLPLTDLYDTEGSGDFSPVKFMARPVVGGHFAPLALERACQGKAYARLRFLDQDTEAIDAEVTLVANEGGLQASEDDGLMEL
jgi:hypothetical protein